MMIKDLNICLLTWLNYEMKYMCAHTYTIIFLPESSEIISLFLQNLGWNFLFTIGTSLSWMDINEDVRLLYIYSFLMWNPRVHLNIYKFLPIMFIQNSHMCARIVGGLTFDPAKICVNILNRSCQVVYDLITAFHHCILWFRKEFPSRWIISVVSENNEFFFSLEFWNQGGSAKYHLNSRWLQVFKSDRDRRDLVSYF